MESLDFLPTLYYGCLRRFMPDVKYMIPASSWAGYEMKRHGYIRKKIPVPSLPGHLSYWAADSGGFVAMKLWGTYPYTPDQYMRWLESVRIAPAWAAIFDFCCEQNLCQTQAYEVFVRDQQERTTEMIYHFWQRYRHTCSFPLVPTIQGSTPESYRRHARQLRPLLEEMQAFYGPSSEWRVGVGSLCKRTRISDIVDILTVVHQELPGMNLHGWGLKVGAFKAKMGVKGKIRVQLPGIKSADSATWHGFFGSDHKKWKKSGKTKMRYAYEIALPEYLAKVEEALSLPEQLILPLL
jgi:hypothetical protein